MKIAQISSVGAFTLAERYSTRIMALAHSLDVDMADKDTIKAVEEYIAKLKQSRLTKILDNGYYELGYSLGAEKLIKIGREIGASYIVLPDGEMSEAALVKKAGFKTIGVITKEEDVKSFVNCSLIDMLGVGLLHTDRIMNARVPFSSFDRREFLEDFRIELKGKPIHLLGAGNNIEEDLNACVGTNVVSMDTSFAFKATKLGIDLKSFKTGIPKPTSLKIKEGGKINFHEGPLDEKSYALMRDNLESISYLAAVAASRKEENIVHFNC